MDNPWAISLFLVSDPVSPLLKLEYLNRFQL